MLQRNVGVCCCTVRRVGLRISALQAGQAAFVHGVARSSGWAASEQRAWPDWMVGAHAARAEPIGPGRDVRAELKLELPKLPGGLPMLRTAMRGARHVAQWTAVGD